QTMFQEADKDGGGALDMDEFREAMRKIVRDVEDEELDIIFMKVDTNCDGTVDWVGNVISFEGLRPYMVHAGKVLHLRKWEGISNSLLILPLASLTRTLVADMVCLHHLNLLAIASTRRDIEFYDISASKCDRVFSLTVLEGYVSVMDYWSDGHKGVFSFGDMDGCLTVFISFDVSQNGLFDIGAFKLGIPSMCVLLSIHSSKFALYNNWCQQVRFLPALNAVATCCTSMVLTTLPHSDRAKVHNSTFRLKKAILCFDYSPEVNILVTGGFDRFVRTWDPHITKTSTSLMKGHMSAVVYVAVNGQDNRIVSFSKDKNVRVWDLQECVCLQNLTTRGSDMGRSPISSLYYNKDSNTLILATSFIVWLCFYLHFFRILKTSHERSVCAALYNSNFKQVVTGCQNGVVSVWDILTGAKVMQFQTSPKKPAEITAMTFDGPKRRLITGSKDGTLRLWNFNNGALLLRLPLLDSNEVTGILYINQRIYVSGWGKRMECSVWNQYHTEDIYSMHAHANKMLVTASYSGDIIIWNLHSGRAFWRFNASESPRPLLRRRPPVQCPLVPPPLPPVLPPIPSSALAESSSPTWVSPLPVHKSSLPQALFLGTRERSPDTAVLLTCMADGYVCAWSIHQQGGLLARFPAVYSEGDFVTSMSTDSQEQMLLTGDRKGYITLWDIKGYCCSSHGERDTAQASLLNSALWFSAASRFETAGACLWPPPPLLSTWRGHLRAVTSLEYVERFRLIVTASLDRNVRVWTIEGCYVGQPASVFIVLRKRGKCRAEQRGSLLQQQGTGASQGEGLVLTDPRIAVYTTEQIEATWRQWEETGKHVRQPISIQDSLAGRVEGYLLLQWYTASSNVD
uniref:WD repeat-containing protein on Y chromosome n=1 Tax=Electrophorus electricus TaxID=8005 RepID=A0A4W4HR41_ELEEL